MKQYKPTNKKFLFQDRKLIIIMAMQGPDLVCLKIFGIVFHMIQHTNAAHL